MAAAVDQIDAAWLQLAVGLLADPVVHHRPVRPRAGDGIERQIAQLAGVAAELVQLFLRGDLIDPALGRFDRQPMQEPHHRRRVARLGGAVAGLLGGVLLRLGQHGGIAVFGDLRPGSRQRREDRLHRALRIDRDFFALERLQRRHEGFARGDADGIAEVRAQPGGDLFFGDEQVRRAVGAGDDK